VGTGKREGIGGVPGSRETRHIACVILESRGVMMASLL